MSKEVTVKEQALATVEWTPEQVKLISDTVAKNATPDELKLFLYRCKKMQLDPLKPGQIYFIKYNPNSPGTIVVGIDGFRCIASRTGKHIGTTRGILRDDKGHCVGAWAEVHRSDWKHPAREEVSISEYNTGKSQWAKMPETMIKKVAESAALRMAFPNELGGLYAPEEMTQVEVKNHHASPEAKTHNGPSNDELVSLAEGKAIDLAEYVIPVTEKYYGKKLRDVPLEGLSGMVKWYMDKMAEGNKFSHKHQEFLDCAVKFLEGAQMAQAPDKKDDVPF